MWSPDMRAVIPRGGFPPHVSAIQRNSMEHVVPVVICPSNRCPPLAYVCRTLADQCDHVHSHAAKGTPCSHALIHNR